MITQMSLDEIYSEMCDKYHELTQRNVEPDTDLSIRFKTLSAELFNLNSKINFIYNQIFPDTAIGEYLDKHCEMYNLERKEASRASGIIRVFVDEPLSYPILIPKGTTFTTSNDKRLQYQTTSNVLMSRNVQHFDIAASSVNCGSEYNCKAGDIDLIVNPPAGITSAININDFTGGANAESDSNLRKRLLQQIKNHSNGYNKQFFIQAISQYEEIAKVQIVPLANGNGTVGVTVAFKDNVVNQSVMSSVENLLNNMLPFCLDISLNTATPCNININSTVYVAQGYDKDEIIEQAENVIRDYVDGLDIGEDLVWNRLGSRLMEIDGVENYKFSTTTNIRIHDGYIANINLLNTTAESWED
ncbi:MAG: baseplate J/gp47 family protein [Clostridiales bacterium]|nr:baseplate J/gp47 family protein [Clostridiales bacterium]